jgi:hypothetical protein
MAGGATRFALISSGLIPRSLLRDFVLIRRGANTPQLAAGIFIHFP